jgi:hypothetical protein
VIVHRIECNSSFPGLLIAPELGKREMVVPAAYYLLVLLHCDARHFFSSVARSYAAVLNRSLRFFVLHSSFVE